jgi:hypothetical protein
MVQQEEDQEDQEDHQDLEADVKLYYLKNNKC